MLNIKSNKIKKFLKVTVDNRIKFGHKFKLCGLSLSAGHYYLLLVTMCQIVEKPLCKLCPQIRHTLLHPKSVPILTHTKQIL